jgi:hypothetical protein
MPKKKLTKAQVKRKMKQIIRATYDLFLDKFAHGSRSDVSFSSAKIMELHQVFGKAFDRIK